MVIVGLDGLDPDLVESWGMWWFKQRCWGRHYVGFLNTLYTPIVWGCFLTGMNVEKHGFSIKDLEEKREKERFRSKFLYMAYRLRRKIPIGNLGLRRILIRLGLINPYQPANMPSNLISKTFIEELRARGYKAVGIEVPGYNERTNEYYRIKVHEMLSRPFSERAKIIEEALRDTEDRAKKASMYVAMDYDLVFMYSPLPDIAFHIVPKPNIKAKVWLRGIHYSLYRAIRVLITNARCHGYAILIVSDHGFDMLKYYHSSYGFWSLNISPQFWKINTVLDFKENIMRLVTVEKAV